MTTTEEGELWHYGTLRKSGRYPWGSGDNPAQRNAKFVDHVNKLKKDGLTESEIAKGMDLTTTQLRANMKIAKHDIKQNQINRASQLREAGNSNVAIGDIMNLNESSVRALLAEGAKEKNDRLTGTMNVLKDHVDRKGMVDVGTGNELYLGVSKETLNTAIAMLEDKGYNTYKFDVEQVGTGKNTHYKVLAKPGIPYKTVYQDPHQIHQIKEFSEDGGKSFAAIQEPMHVDSKRVGVRYAEQGGTNMDGVIQVRPGVHDLSLGNSRYAQVRISVDGTHYLKGMAIYSDDLPKGVDLMFNTNKSDTGNKLDAMKPQKVDKETGKIDQTNPFGAIVRQQFEKHADGSYVLDKNGNKKLSSAMNIVNEEGAWDKWSKNIASQALSKQSPALAKTQLGLKLDSKKAEFEEIMALNNPAVKKKLLQSFADDVDSSSVHLKAAAMPRQKTQVILPLTKIKEDEIYAPNFRNGEKVVLIRYPHGGTFEIPELTVNNRDRPAIAAIKGAKDGVGIHPRVAERLSGADFDGDNVIVIPNNSRAFKTTPALAGLKDFDAKAKYKMPDSKPGIKDSKNPTAMTGRLMGDVSNLITDMTIKGASESELARAVRHSMVVIDAQKHHLDYKQSAVDNSIAELKKKYQGGANKGSSTIISRATSPERVIKRVPRPAALGGAIDPVTGKKMFVEAKDARYTRKDGTEGIRYESSKKMAEVSDARSLISNKNTEMEKIYANHANALKSLANQARREYLKTPNQKLNSSAKIAYSKEVASLNNKLTTALMNAPLERQAQLIANANIRAKMQANPDMDKAEIKKLKSLALEEARNRYDAKKTRIEVTPLEWNAIQAGAISQNQLDKILANMKDEDIKALATPRDAPTMSPAKISRAKNLLRAGYTAAEVADTLGVAVSTLNTAVEGA